MLSTIDFNELLRGSEKGDAEKTAYLFPIVYEELKRIAHNQMRGAWSVQTMQATALINEAYLKLLGHQKHHCADKSHFFAICAKAMRQILINYAQQKNAQKRGSERDRVTYSEEILQLDQQEAYSFETLLTVDRALVELSEVDEHLSQLVELRFFAGMTESDIASMSGVSERTVRRDWKKAKALLSQALKSD
ncbi:MAG: RNA polymerase sigma factor (TIGR02999 family) [Alphaproteobacteria bacterium]